MFSNDGLRECEHRFEFGSGELEDFDNFDVLFPPVMAPFGNLAVERGEFGSDTTHDGENKHSGSSVFLLFFAERSAQANQATVRWIKLKPNVLELVASNGADYDVTRLV